MHSIDRVGVLKMAPSNVFLCPSLVNMSFEKAAEYTVGIFCAVTLIYPL